MAGLAAAVAIHTGLQEPAANAAVAAPSAQGTDVSNLTSVSSWANVKAAGITFTGVMAFDGASVNNPSYNAQVTGALAQNLFVMPYVVADPLKIGGAAQFAKAWPVIDGVTSAPYAGGGQYLPVALDMEAQPQVTPDACYGLSKASMVAWIQAFLNAAQQQTSVTPIVYSNPNWWQACTGGSTAFGGYPLWIADYGVRAPAIPVGWSGYTFWQNSGNATLNGIAGAGQADLDQLGGDLITVKSGTSGSFQVRTLSSLAGQPVTYSAASTLPNGVSMSASGKLSWTSAAPAGALAVKCLDVVGGSTANGAKLQLYTCNSADLGQVWQAGTDSQLVNVKSKKCLDVPVARAGNGTRAVIEPCANSATQPNEHWLRPAAPLVSGTPGKCAAVSGAAAVLAGCANTTAQHWQAQPDGTARAAGKCLASGTTAGSAVSVAACSGAASTKWQLVSKNPVAVQVSSGGLCVTVPSSGMRLIMEPCVNNATDTWQLR